MGKSFDFSGNDQSTFIATRMTTCSLYYMVDWHNQHNNLCTAYHGYVVVHNKVSLVLAHPIILPVKHGIVLWNLPLSRWFSLGEAIRLMFWPFSIALAFWMEWAPGPFCRRRPKQLRLFGVVKPPRSPGRAISVTSSCPVEAVRQRSSTCDRPGMNAAACPLQSTRV